ncbi:uncharacterized protein [Drosophila takahashii]|uniref:uncharacterized protein n=1 Tax=Drosophila takahashii TaxID=29030 RepID=UPI001CF81D91|nr:uncharacterized protein LOC108064284 [Drosophila takahashii]
MPVLELFTVMDNVYHGFRRCFGPEKPTRGTKLPANNTIKKLSKRRRRILNNKRSSRHSRRNNFPTYEKSEESVANSLELKEYFTRGKFPASITLGREPDINPSLDLLNRRRLQNRPLILNARQVFQVQWGCWWQRSWPTLVAASMQMSCGSSVLCHSLLGLYDDEESDPPIVVLMCYFGQALKKLCKQADLAICSNGHGPTYITTSAAMELIDIRDFFQQINNALVDYLLRVADSEISIGE